MENISTKDSLKEKILNLSGDEKIIIQIDEQLCKDLRYIFFQRDGLLNIVMSYINNTSELANQMNFEKFVQRIAESQIQQNQLIKEIGIKYLGEEMERYLSMHISPSEYTIDFNNRLLIIETKETTARLSSVVDCGCGNGYCEA